jgi:hypothetical protein
VDKASLCVVVVSVLPTQQCVIEEMTAMMDQMNATAVVSSGFIFNFLSSMPPKDPLAPPHRKVFYCVINFNAIWLICQIPVPIAIAHP